MLVNKSVQPKVIRPFKMKKKIALIVCNLKINYTN
jgi:hypothetical protein